MFKSYFVYSRRVCKEYITVNLQSKEVIAGVMTRTTNRLGPQVLLIKKV